MVILMLVILLAACGGDTVFTATSTNPVASTTTAAATTTAASTTAVAEPRLVWSRVPDDESVFGGSGNQTMWGVAVAGCGLVAIGEDFLGDDADAAVWVTLPPG
jgi:hypothetical protein